ncbi:MAG: hypothetical protein RLZZ153_2021 [Pseudomonadota bacterium]|jgi:hypothetical protein
MATDGISRATTSHTSAAAGLTAAGTGGTTLERGIAANLATSRAINAYMEAMSEDLRQANDTAKSLGDLQVFMSEKIKGTFKSSTDLDARLDLQEDFKNAYKSQLKDWAQKEHDAQQAQRDKETAAYKEALKKARNGRDGQWAEFLVRPSDFVKTTVQSTDDLITKAQEKIRNMYRNTANPEPVSERKDVIRDGDLYYQKNSDGSKGDLLSMELYETYVRQAATMKRLGVGTPEQWKMLKDVDIPYRQVETLTTAASTAVQTNTNYISRLNNELTALKTRMDEVMQDAARKLSMQGELSQSFSRSV